MLPEFLPTTSTSPYLRIGLVPPLANIGRGSPGQQPDQLETIYNAALPILQKDLAKLRAAGSSCDFEQIKQRSLVILNENQNYLNLSRNAQLCVRRALLIEVSDNKEEAKGYAQNWMTLNENVTFEDDALSVDVECAQQASSMEDAKAAL